MYTLLLRKSLLIFKMHVTFHEFILFSAAIDYASSLLCDGHGACFVVSPPSAPLPPFSTTTITIIAYSNMWGQYSDQLLCKVSGYILYNGNFKESNFSQLIDKP